MSCAVTLSTPTASERDVAAFFSCFAGRRHQGSAPPEDTGVIISEEELEAQSKQNVERWVSAHIIPVS